MRRCEDEKMFYRPPLLEEPCAQTLSGKRLFWKLKEMAGPSRIQSSVGCLSDCCDKWAAAATDHVDPVKVS